VPTSPQQPELALDQPGSAGPTTLRLAAAAGLLVVAFAFAVGFFGDVQLPAFPQFVTFHAVFIVVVDSIVAYMLFGQFVYRRRIAYAVLGAAYLFSALVALPFLLSFPGALRSGAVIVGGPQSAVWVWHAWHIVFPLLVGASLLLHERAPDRKVSAQHIGVAAGVAVATAVALAALVAIAVTAFHDRLAPLLTAQGQPLPPAFYAAGALAVGIAAAVLALAVWVGRRRSVLHIWLAISLTAFLGNVVANVMATGRYSLGWYAGRMESMVAAGVLLLVFLGGINGLYRRLGASVGALFLTNRRLAALVAEKEALVAELRQREEEIRRLAYYDPLTHLPNRRLLMDRLGQDLLRNARLGQAMAVLFLDLDRFKVINDELGHEAGDALLREVGERLSACVRSSDTVSRLAGDEFVIVLPHVTRAEDAVTAAEKVIDVFAAPVHIAGRDLTVSTSIGIAIAPPGTGVDANVLLARADAAMYAAKKAGRNGYRLGEPSGRDALPLGDPRPLP
jgi:diguanylate cyclase (GGDEF)-like protein